MVGSERSADHIKIETMEPNQQQFNWALGSSTEELTEVQIHNDPELNIQEGTSMSPVTQVFHY